MVQSDQRLARRIAQGDRKAFAEFVDTYGARVHRLVHRYAHSEADAEDLTQEIFLNLYRGIAGFQGASQLSTWIYRVALNHCLKYRQWVTPGQVPYDEAMQVEESQESSPAHRAIRQELADEVHSALNGLSSLHRDVIILHELHGLTYSECAELLQVPVGTVKSRLSHAFRRLRSCLGGYVLGEEGIGRPVADTAPEILG